MLDSIKLHRTLWLGKHLTVIFIIVVMYDENIAKVSILFKLKGCKIYAKVFFQHLTLVVFSLCFYVEYFQQSSYYAK